MGVRNWIAEFKVEGAATPATTATAGPSVATVATVARVGDAALDCRDETAPNGKRDLLLDEAAAERTAIMEYDGELNRDEAERLATQTRWRGDGLDLGDLRPCLWCRNFTRTGRCLAAWRGELRAAQDYMPSIPGRTHRCISYLPPPDDPDQRPGTERWPEMVEDQARRTH